MSESIYKLDSEAFEQASINLSQVSAMLNILAETGEGKTEFQSHEEVVQVIYASRQMVQEAKEKLRAGFKGIVPVQSIEPEPLTSGM
ncbi:hypothetical protein [Flavobacterium sp. W21_SRS_FM6]|uniref:hypothetical protein n=1 Tax=Flavobacterium sp. W21_SRS_FM6 TaxID=3240268 RepID=UPI003F8DABBC